MKQHLNTLFVTSENAFVAKEGQSVSVKIDGKQQLRVPLHNIGGIVCFGAIGCSPALMAFCAENNVAISFMTTGGRFLAKVSGFTSGNVLLRREQYRRADDTKATVDIVRSFLLGKIANSRSVLMRAARDHPDGEDRGKLTRAVSLLGEAMDDVNTFDDPDQLRGLEGNASRTYFSVLNSAITNPDEAFRFNGRNRRPPKDRVNALLSFLYAMLTHDARSACEAAGLDPAVGFLHRDRPGRPGLALDLVEEFRSFLADRVALSLINRQQVRAGGFELDEGGGVTMDDETRKTVLTTYQKRKQETITHPFLGEKTTVGLLVHLQARLLARYLRGELDAYPPFLAR